MIALIAKLRSDRHNIAMTRFHDLDALRAFAMLLGVVLHAALFLIPIDWPGVAREASFDLPYDEIVHAIHGFRMPVFFLLSGFFTAMLWEHRGLRAMINHRLKRVGLPLLIGAFTIIPLQSWWWLTTSGEELTLWSLIFLVPFSWLYDLQLLWFFMGVATACWHLRDRYSAWREVQR